MGLYLNSKNPHNNYQKIVNSDYFVDKTGLLEELIPVVGTWNDTNGGARLLPSGRSNKYICITRPRRFGKTIAANMIASYFGKGYDSHPIFDYLKVSSHEQYARHLNKHNVLHITLNEIPRNCRNYDQYINRIQDRMLFPPWWFMAF